MTYAFIKNELPDGSGCFSYGQWYNALTNSKESSCFLWIREQLSRGNSLRINITSTKGKKKGCPLDTNKTRKRDCFKEDGMALEIWLFLFTFWNKSGHKKRYGLWISGDREVAPFWLSRSACEVTELLGSVWLSGRVWEGRAMGTGCF